MKLAIIPARGGSKRIPSKSIIEFCGRPIIDYSLVAAATSGLFDEIHVSTDSPEIRATVEQLGYDIPFMRPDALADDQTPLIPVARWVLEEFRRHGKSFDDVCLLLPCAPLIEPEDLANGHDAFLQGGRTIPVHGVAPYPAPIEWAFERDADGRLVPCEPGKFATRSQHLTPKFFETGMVSWFSARQILDPDFFGGGDALSFELPAYRAVDIDDPEDVMTAEILYLGLREYRRRQSKDGATK